MTPAASPGKHAFNVVVTLLALSWRADPCVTASESNRQNRAQFDFRQQSSRCADSCQTSRWPAWLAAVEHNGFVDQGYTWNPDDPANGSNGTVICNYLSNDYLLDQLFLHVSPKFDENPDQFQISGGFDVLLGSDAYIYNTIGLDSKLISDSVSKIYKLCFPQLYVEAYSPLLGGTTIQVGTYYALVGIAAIPANQNFFYSSTNSNQAGPNTHTGMIASFPLGDQISCQFGPNYGTNIYINSENSINYTGGVTWTSQDEKTSLGFSFLSGTQLIYLAESPLLPRPPRSNQFMYGIVLTRQFNNNTKMVLQHCLQPPNRDPGLDIKGPQFYSIELWLEHNISENWTAGFRGEWLRAGSQYVLENTATGANAPSGSYYAITLGLHWKPHPRIMLRPEIRWDWQHRDSLAAPAVFDDGTSTHQFLIATDVLMTF